MAERRITKIAKLVTWVDASTTSLSEHVHRDSPPARSLTYWNTVNANEWANYSPLPAPVFACIVWQQTATIVGFQCVATTWNKDMTARPRSRAPLTVQFPYQSVGQVVVHDCDHAKIGLRLNNEMCQINGWVRLDIVTQCNVPFLNDTTLFDIHISGICSILSTARLMR